MVVIVLPSPSLPFPSLPLLCLSLAFLSPLPSSTSLSPSLCPILLSSPRPLCPVCPIPLCSPAQCVLHDLPWICRRCAQPTLAAQTPPPHGRLTSSTHDLLCQWRVHYSHSAHNCSAIFGENPVLGCVVRVACSYLDCHGDLTQF